MSCAGMIKVVGIVVLSALFLGESSIFTTRQALAPHAACLAITLRNYYAFPVILSQDQTACILLRAVDACLTWPW